MSLSARKQAKQAGEKRYYTGNLCAKGHLAERFTSNGRCVICADAGYKNWRSENLEADRLRAREWKSANPDVIAKNMKDWIEKNPDYFKRHYLANKDKYLTYSRNREIAAINRTPAWLTDTDFEEIAKIYKTAKDLTRTTGIAHHVDHIIPLQGRLVSGLHVPSNLRVIPATENLRKRNSFTPYTERAAQIGL